MIYFRGKSFLLLNQIQVDLDFILSIDSNKRNLLLNKISYIPVLTCLKNQILLF